MLGGGSAFGLIAWGSGKPSPFTKPQPVIQPSPFTEPQPVIQPSPFTKPQPASPVPSPSLSQPASQPSPFTEPQPAIQPSPFTKPQPISQPSFFTGPQSAIQPCLFSKPQPASQPSLKPREGFELNSPAENKQRWSNEPPQEQTENGVTNPLKNKQKTE